MGLVLIVAAIVLGVIVLVGAIGYWIDEAEEPLEHGASTSERHHHPV